MKISELSELMYRLWILAQGVDTGEHPWLRRSLKGLRRPHWYQPVLIWGESGIGKSESIHQIAEKLNDAEGLDEGDADFVNVIDLRLGELELGDLIGLPREQEVYPDPVLAMKGKSSRLYTKADLIKHLRTTYPQYEGMNARDIWADAADLIKEYGSHLTDFQTVYALPRWFPREGSRGFLFLDELNRSQKDVRQAIFQLLLDRKMHETRLPDGWVIVSAVNPHKSSGGKKGYDVDRLYDRAFMARFLHVGLIPDTQEWLEYAASTGVDLIIRGLIAGDAKLLGPVNVEIPELRATPRSWSRFSRLVPALDGLAPTVVKEIADGMLGQTEGTAWFSARSRPERPLSAKEIIETYHLPFQQNDARERMLDYSERGLTDVIHASFLNLEAAMREMDTDNLSATLFDEQEKENVSQVLRDVGEYNADISYQFLKNVMTSMPAVIRSFSKDKRMKEFVKKANRGAGVQQPSSATWMK